MQRLSIQPVQTAMRSAMQQRLAITRSQALVHSSGGSSQRAALLSTSTRRLAEASKPSPAASSTQSPSSRQTASAGESQKDGHPEELPKFSLDGLGVSKNMKIFLVVVLSIFGTMETWFYCKAIYRWWYGEQGLAVTEDNK